jgi:hypothetical protein
MLMDDSTKLTPSELKEKVEGYVGEEAAELAVGIVIHSIARLSIVGQPILDSWKDLKQKRINERVLTRKIRDFRNTEGLAMVQIRCLGGFETKNEAFA